MWRGAREKVYDRENRIRDKKEMGKRKLRKGKMNVK
jgi:hypothetical protein